MNTDVDPHTTHPDTHAPTRLSPAHRLDRLGAIAGMTAGALFLATVTLLTWLRYDYLHSLGWTISDDGQVPWPSSLALGDHGWAQIANFAITGLLLLLFVRALRHHLPERTSASVASTLMTMMALAMIALAAPTDPKFGAEPSTWHGWTHGIAFVVVVVGSIITPAVTARALRRDERWRPLARVSLAVPVLGLACLAVPSQIGFYAFLVILFGWFAVLAARLYRLSAG
jgi:hypothetical protein